MSSHLLNAAGSRQNTANRGPRLPRFLPASVSSSCEGALTPGLPTSSRIENHNGIRTRHSMPGAYLTRVSHGHWTTGTVRFSQAIAENKNAKSPPLLAQEVGLPASGVEVQMPALSECIRSRMLPGRGWH